MKENIIYVHMGEVKIAKNGEILKSILGSCVGIGFIWKKRSICGLAHCLLAESPQKTFTIGGRFVDQAIPSLIAMMKLQTQDLTEVEVILAGGGNMTQPGAQDVGRLVGSHNFSVALRELSKLGITPKCADPAEEEGRRMTLYSANGSYLIEPIPRLTTAT